MMFAPGAGLIVVLPIVLAIYSLPAVALALACRAVAKDSSGVSKRKAATWQLLLVVPSIIAVPGALISILVGLVVVVIAPYAVFDGGLDLGEGGLVFGAGVLMLLWGYFMMRLVHLGIADLDEAVKRWNRLNEEHQDNSVL